MKSIISLLYYLGYGLGFIHLIFNKYNIMRKPTVKQVKTQLRRELGWNCLNTSLKAEYSNLLIEDTIKVVMAFIKKQKKINK